MPQFDSPIVLPAKGEPLVVQGRWAWDDCYFATVVILQPPPPTDDKAEPPDFNGAMGTGTPFVGQDPKKPARTIWRLALNSVPGAAPLKAGQQAKAFALAVGPDGGEIKAVAWESIVEVEDA